MIIFFSILVNAIDKKAFFRKGKHIHSGEHITQYTELKTGT